MPAWIGQFREQLRGLGVVFYVSVALVAGFVALGIFATDIMERYAEHLLSWTTVHFGWMYLFATTGFVLFAAFLAVSRFGRLRLGAPGEEPEFGFGSWLAMIFAGGMGVGLVFWGVAEPMVHFNDPPMGLAPADSEAAAQLGLRYAIFHWGLHQWANFTLVGLAIAYVRFRHSSRGLISEAFRPLWGDRVDGGLGYAVDVLAVVSTTFGVATTLGLGALQINSGLDRVAGVPVDVSTQFMILGAVAILFTLSALTALDQGIRILSNINMYLAAGLLVAVFVLGPTTFIVTMMTNAVGDYFSHFVEMSFRTTPFSQDRWVEKWTLFYWAWGLSWAPFVGTFIARISRGRTIREFVLGVMLVPVGLSILWFSTFGGAALHAEIFDGAGIAAAVDAEVPSALFALFATLPEAWTTVLSGAAVLLVVMFVITSADSATFVLGMFTSKGVLNPVRFVRVLWGSLQLLVAAVLLLSGGLVALRTISIIAAFPFMLLMVLMAFALYRDLAAELRREEADERHLLARVEQYLLNEEEREAARRAAEEAHPTVGEEPPAEPPAGGKAAGTNHDEGDWRPG